MPETHSQKIIPLHLRPYRIGMGIAVFNEKNEIFIAERYSQPGSWQLPQGGVTLQEIEDDLIGAALRELDEETGMTNVSLLCMTKDWMHYDFPPDGEIPGTSFKYRGQRQKWIAVRYHGSDDEIDLTTHEEIEFRDWRWGQLNEISDLIIDFKRPVYDFVQDCFAHIPANQEPDLSKVIKL